nr:hypothetical protein [Tanacetum cinerariifolium]
LPVAPPSPDYMPGPEEPQTPPTPQDEDEHELMFTQPHDPDFMPEPIYPEYIPLEDEHILPAEEQPLPPVVSPTAESPGYVPESDLEEDPEEYEEDKTKDGQVNYPMAGGDNGDDDNGDSFGYDADDEDEDEEDEEEEEEHLALANSTVDYYPTTDFHIPSTRGRGERLASCMAPAALPSPPLPPSLYPTPHVDRGDGILESKQPPRNRLCLSTLGSREVGYGIKDTWIDLAEKIMAPITRQGHNLPPPNTNTSPHHMTPKSVQAMINQALLGNSTNGDGSQSSHKDNLRHVQTTRPYFYADFMKCHPLNFKGNKGVSDQDLGPEAYAMTWEVLKKKMTNKYCPQGELKKLEIEL